MENRKHVLEDIKHLISLTPNTYLVKEIEKIQELIKKETNDQNLGSLLRKIL